MLKGTVIDDEVIIPNKIILSQMIKLFHFDLDDNDDRFLRIKLKHLLCQVHFQEIGHDALVYSQDYGKNKHKYHINREIKINKNRKK